MSGTFFYFALILFNLIILKEARSSSIPEKHLAQRDQSLSSRSRDFFSNNSIRHAAGKTVSSSIPIHFDHRNPSSPSTVQKRANHLQNNCPRTQTFVSSRCLPHISPQAYEVTCSRPHYSDNTAVVQTTAAGNCGNTQICINAIAPPLNALEHAYCIDCNEPIVIPHIQPTENYPSWDELEQWLNSGGSIEQSEFVGAVLTGPDSRTSVFAKTLGLQAQAFNMVRGKPVWETLRGGTNECGNCSSVSLQPVPQGTKRVLVHVVWEAVLSTAALLYVEKVTA